MFIAVVDIAYLPCCTHSYNLTFTLSRELRPSKASTALRGSHAHTISEVQPLSWWTNLVFASEWAGYIVTGEGGSTIVCLQLTFIYIYKETE